MKSDCIFNCLKNQFDSNCMNLLYLTSTMLLREKKLPSFPVNNNCSRLINFKSENSHHIHQFCNEQCKSGCYQAQYSYESKKKQVQSKDNL